MIAKTMMILGQKETFVEEIVVTKATIKMSLKC